MIKIEMTVEVMEMLCGRFRALTSNEILYPFSRSSVSVSSTKTKSKRRVVFLSRFMTLQRRRALESALQTETC